MSIYEIATLTAHLIILLAFFTVGGLLCWLAFRPHFSGKVSTLWLAAMTGLAGLSHLFVVLATDDISAIVLLLATAIISIGSVLHLHRRIQFMATLVSTEHYRQAVEEVRQREQELQGEITLARRQRDILLAVMQSHAFSPEVRRELEEILQILEGEDVAGR